jgi:hypothetical protein
MAVATLLLRNHVQNTIVSNHRLFRENSDQLQRFDFEFSVSEWSKIAGFERKAKQRIRGKSFLLLTNIRCYGN